MSDHNKHNVTHFIGLPLAGTELGHDCLQFIASQSDLLPVKEEKLHLTIGWFNHTINLNIKQIEIIQTLIATVVSQLQEIILKPVGIISLGTGVHLEFFHNQALETLRAKLKQTLSHVIDLQWVKPHVKVAKNMQNQLVTSEIPFYGKSYIFNTICLMHLDHDREEHIIDHAFLLGSKTVSNTKPSLYEVFTKIGLKNVYFASNTPIAKQFNQQGIDNLYAAIEYVYNLKYAPPSDPFNWNLVLEQQQGTCSTRHALLTELAQEIGVPFKLASAIYNMTPEKFPVLAAALKQAGIPYIPESHNFIIYKNYYLDVTFPGAAKILDPHDVEHVQEIKCQDLLHVKKVLYPQFLQQWLHDNNINLSLEEYSKVHAKFVDLLGKTQQN